MELRDDEAVAHAAVVERVLRIGGLRSDVGSVEAVATAPAAPGLGDGTLAVEEIGRIIDRRHGIGVTSTGRPTSHGRLGRTPWRGPTSVRRATGVTVRTPADDSGIMVPSTAPIDLDAPIECDERPGDDG